MRTWLGIVAAGVLSGTALAQTTAPPAAPAKPAEPPPGGYTQLFMSPCGEPWRAGKDDPYPMFAWFKATDTNHDGAVDLAEFRADFAGFFDALDQDHNGLLDGAEISFYERRIAPDVLLGQKFGAIAGPILASGVGQGAGGRGLWGGELILAQQGTLGNSQVYTPSGARGPMPDLGAQKPPKQELIGAGAFGFLNDAEPVSTADTDLDGRVTKLEFLAAADRRFKRLDRNGDGKLTISELPKSRAQVEAEASAPRRRR
jgi:hypothetical protein